LEIKQYINRIALIFTSLFLLWMMTGLFLSFALAQQNKTVELTVYNSYGLSVQLEIKCDWNNKKGGFDYHQFVVIPGKKNSIIKVPSYLKKCQIWPQIKW
jgi:hypothetical protein